MKSLPQRDTGTMLPGLVEERKRMLAARTAGKVYRPTRVTNSSMPNDDAEGYKCPDLIAPAVRPGADDALQIPSRYGSRLHYRDGRVVFLTTATPT